MQLLDEGPRWVESDDDALEIERVHEHCSIYTHPDVAGAMLDAVGWVGDADLKGKRLLEPCCGDGSFLRLAVDRLLVWARREANLDEGTLGDAITAFEFDRVTAEAARTAVKGRLEQAGIASDTARRLALRWVRTEDFLLATRLGTFSHVVGNPPYMRWSKLPPRLKTQYEAAIDPVAAKGDICLAFIWRCAGLIDDLGVIALLCADRWLRCAYGEQARAELAKSLRIAAFFEAHDLPVFVGKREVSAYAGVTILDRERESGATVVRPDSLGALSAALRNWRTAAKSKQPQKAPSLRGDGSAILADDDTHRLLSALAEGYPILADAGVGVRCGVALGHAKTFLVGADAEIEPQRLLPYIRSDDLNEDGSTSASRMLVNPWDCDGRLVDLARWPRLEKHLTASREVLAARACVSGRQDWYRTIDRLPADRPAGRIFVAGMARRSRVALSRPDEVPGNAIYVLSTQSWPPAALYAMLRSGLLDLHAAGLASTFAGGTKRFDGTFLRQVRLPLWSMVSRKLQQRLVGLDTSVPVRRPQLLADVFRLKSARARRALDRTLNIETENGS